MIARVLVYIEPELLTNLKIVEDSLQGESDALGAVVRLRRHLVDGLPEDVGEVQNLLSI
jgi:hypothetical protein